MSHWHGRVCVHACGSGLREQADGCLSCQVEQLTVEGAPAGRAYTFTHLRDYGHISHISPTTRAHAHIHTHLSDSLQLNTVYHKMEIVI